MSANAYRMPSVTTEEAVTAELASELRALGLLPHAADEAATVAVHAAYGAGDGSCFRAWSALIVAGAPVLEAQRVLIKCGLYPARKV